MFRRLHVPFRRTLPDPQSSNPPSDISGPIHEDGVDSKADANLSRPKAISNTVQSQEHREAEAGPLGLTVVYTPENARTADIVFIHGLGGTSHWTWSKNRDPELFWPLKFLPLEPDVGSARILTFGYNANFLRAGSVITSVLDFAKDLLFDLKYAKDGQKDDLGMGSVSITQAS
ncbi:hypothetical protein F5Y13DRAFT_158938 [Hypoxylon sp. FL1857]|nr:hypothetical protein F5Y13DRAFT_158938 [Hypoxylon sp. FL1857]